MHVPNCVTRLLTDIMLCLQVVLQIMGVTFMTQILRCLIWNQVSKGSGNDLCANRCGSNWLNVPGFLLLLWLGVSSMPASGACQLVPRKAGVWCESSTSSVMHIDCFKLYHGGYHTLCGHLPFAAVANLTRIIFILVGHKPVGARRIFFPLFCTWPHLQLCISRT